MGLVFCCCCLFCFFFNFSIVKMTRSLWNTYVKGIPNRARPGSSRLPFWDGWILWEYWQLHLQKLWDQQCGSSPVVWWLELGAFTAVTWVQPVVGALRSCKLHGVAKEKKKKKERERERYNTVEDLTNGRTHQPPGFLQLLCFSPTCIWLSMCMHRLEPACLQKGKGDVTVSVWR